MTTRKRAVLPAPIRRRKIPHPVVTPEFRAECHKTLDAILDHHPGTDSIAIIVDGLSGCNMVSHPKALSVKKGLLLEVYDAVIGPEKT